jgi:hypothetical protein
MPVYSGRIPLRLGWVAATLATYEGAIMALA